MLCPICSTKIAEQQKGLFMCPNGHGALVTGKYLSDIEETPTLSESKSTTDTKQEIMCPHCSKVMHKVDYNSTDIIIDACTNCYYRWLDAGEVGKIRNFKPKTEAKDLLLIADLDEKIRQFSKQEVKEANPRLPLQGSYRAGAEIATGISGDSRVRLGAIFGQGLYGIYKGLTHSKTSRYLTIITLLIFVALFFLIFIDYKGMIGN